MGAPFFSPYKTPCCLLGIALTPLLPASLVRFSPAIAAPMPDAWPFSWAYPASVYSPSVIFLQTVSCKVLLIQYLLSWPFLAFWKKQIGLLAVIPDLWVHFSCSSGHTAGQSCISCLFTFLEQTEDLGCSLSITSASLVSSSGSWGILFA